jgi:hypothetical protein
MRIGRIEELLLVLLRVETPVARNLPVQRDGVHGFDLEGVCFRYLANPPVEHLPQQLEVVIHRYVTIPPPSAQPETFDVVRGNARQLFVPEPNWDGPYNKRLHPLETMRVVAAFTSCIPARFAIPPQTVECRVRNCRDGHQPAVAETALAYGRPRSVCLFRFSLARHGVPDLTIKLKR